MSNVSKLERLMYSIGVVDKATGPVNKIMAKINQLSSQAGNAQNQMMNGFIGAASGGYALSRSLAPSIDHVAALGETKSIGATDKQLNKLTQTAFEFSGRWGGNSADFVRSSYEIQQGIKGLKNNELSDITKLSNLTAVALKGDANTISSTFTKIYKSVKTNADELNKVQFFEKLSGQLSLAQTTYQMDSTTMGSAFSKLGGKATAKGVDLSEQISVIGILKDFAKSGSAASGLYAGFLDKLSVAGKKLNLDFYDNGKLLTTDKILEKINTRFNGATKAQREYDLDTVFGASGRQAIDYLSNQMPRLISDRKEFQKISDSSKTVQMANDIASPWDRLGGTFNDVSTALGLRLLPVFEPFIEMLSTSFVMITNLTNEFPYLSSVVATLIVGVVGLMTAIGVFNILIGLSKYGIIGLSGTKLLLSKSIAMVNSAYKFARTSLLAFHLLSITSGGAMAVLRMAMLSATSSVWAFTSALLLNPIGLIVAGIATSALLIYKYWQPIKAFMSGFWDGLSEGLQPVFGAFSHLTGSLSFIGDLFSWISNQIGAVISWFGSLLSPVDATAQQLDVANKAGVGFGKNVAKALNFILTPLKAILAVNAKVIESLGYAGNAIKEFFGFGDTEVIANKVNRVQSDLSTNYVDKINQTIPSNVVPISSHVAFSENIENQKNSNTQSTIGAVKVEKSEFANQLSNSLTNNSSSDNSKRVYIDSVTMKSDNLAHDFEQLLEMAG